MGNISETQSSNHQEVTFMTITQMIQNRQQQRIGELAQKQQGKPHVNPYGTPGMSLNDAGDFRKMVPVDEGVVQQVKQIAFDHRFSVGR